jgi:hypothetical protein
MGLKDLEDKTERINLYQALLNLYQSLVSLKPDYIRVSEPQEFLKRKQPLPIK